MRDLEMAFVGKITAGMTHEIKNSLAIILESSGLLADLITLAPEGSFPHQDKFLRVLSNINDQVNRGVDLTSRLNRFAHSMDEPLATIKLPDLLEQVVLLMQRLARRQGIKLAVMAADPALTLRNDPFRLLLVLATVIETLAGSLESGGGIILHASGAPQEVTIWFEVQGPQKPGWQGWKTPLFPALEDLLKVLPARLAGDAPPDGAGVTLTMAVNGAGKP